MPDLPLAVTGHDFTSGARFAVADARRRASAHNLAAVGTEHLLLALTEKPDASVVHVLAALNLDPSVIRSAVKDTDKTVASFETVSRRVKHGGGPGFTATAKRVLAIAMDEARTLGDVHVGTEHLLLALCAESAGRAAHALQSLNISYARLQDATRGLHDGPPRDTRTTGHTASFRIAIDDTSGQSIYEQIVARIQEGIAMSALRPGERLPTVRQLADELDVAPGTVARAYAELERTGLVVTEGTRGTRIAEREHSSAPHSDLHVTLVGLLRPVAVAAFHLGATAEDLHAALTEAIRDIFPPAA